MTAYLSAFDSDGVSIIPNVLSPLQCDVLAVELSAQFGAGPGSRQALRNDRVRALGRAMLQHKITAWSGDASYRLVQCIYFDKSERNNWLVAWHQDLSIPVRDRLDAPGFSGWQRKDDSWFVQPPIEILKRLLVVRVSLDGCDEQNGALHVVPGSHHMGRIPATQASGMAAERKRMSCVVKKGDALLMRPLVLHASSKAISSRPRRVLHYVFGPATLPAGVEWSITNEQASA